MSNDEVLFCGDPHGRFEHIIAAVADHRPVAVVLLGDMDLEIPLHEALAPVVEMGVPVRWIPGNHDSDQDHYHDNLFHSDWAAWNVHGQVVQLGELRMAGLGGVFRGRIWCPEGELASRNYDSRAELISQSPKNVRWRGGVPRKHTTTIFPEDVEQLSKERAHVLVTHEAPSSHKNGFVEIDRLAEKLRAEVIVHGHHHVAYDETLPSGVRVVGVEIRGLRYIPVAELMNTPAAEFRF